MTCTSCKRYCTLHTVPCACATLHTAHTATLQILLDLDARRVLVSDVDIESGHVTLLPGALSLLERVSPMLRVLQSSSSSSSSVNNSSNSGSSSGSGTAKLRRTPLYEPSEQQAGAAEVCTACLPCATLSIASYDSMILYHCNYCSCGVAHKQTCEQVLVDIGSIALREHCGARLL
jgi:hypothetical protein